MNRYEIVIGVTTDNFSEDQIIDYFNQITKDFQETEGIIECYIEDSYEMVPQKTPESINK